jgi:hypothetical protein
MAPLSLKATPPPPGDKTVRDALLRAFRVRGLEPQDSWVSVRLAYAPWLRERMYTVIIAYPQAPALLLRRCTPKERPLSF